MRSRMEKRALVACNGREDDAKDLLQTLKEQRANRLQSPSSYRQDIVIFWGFGEVSRRNAALSLLAEIARPRISYVSQIDTCRYEGFFVCKAGIAWDLIWPLLAMGMGHVTAERWMDSVTLAAITRIERGTSKWGNWLYARNDARRKEYTRAMELRREREKAARDQERVLQHTGMSFSVENMVALHRQYQNALTHITRLVEETEWQREQLLHLSPFGGPLALSTLT